MVETQTQQWTTIWTTVAALATLGAAVAAALAAKSAAAQVRLTRFSLGVDMVQRLDARFDSPEFLEARRSAALALENLKDNDYAENRAIEANVEPVLDFFETIGLLVRREVLDKEIVHSYFFYWYYGYWLNAKPLIDRQRKKFPARYGDFLDLHGELLKFEDEPINKEEWADFLTGERTGG